MYSVVLMAAMTSGANAPDTWWRSYGGYGHGWGVTVGFSHGCYGCYGGWGGYGSWGSCYGCGGGWGGCYGGWSSCYGCGGCWGSCHGCGGCWGCYGGAVIYHSPVIHSAPGTIAPSGSGQDYMRPADTIIKPAAITSVGLPVAKMNVDLPPSATLFVDDQPVKVDQKDRAFTTPVLEPGRTYYYELRAELQLDGKTVTETKRVTFRAGDTVEARFADLLARASKHTIEFAGRK